MSFFFSIIWVILITNVDASKPYELVDKVCSEQGNKNFCLDVLKSDERSKFAKDINTLMKVVVAVATKSSTQRRDHFRRVKKGPPGVLKSLKYCIDSYNNVILNFKICLNEDDCSLIGYDIHVAGDEVRRCQSLVDANNAHHSFITSSNIVTLDFCLLGESLANRMCDN